MTAVKQIASLLDKIDKSSENKEANDEDETIELPNIPDKMQAIQVVNGKLTLKTVDTPKLNSRCVLIKIYGSAVNRADLLQAAGKYPPPKGVSNIIGLECSGIIVKYNKQCKLIGKLKKFKLNTKIMALLGGGGYAEYASVHELNLIKLTNNINLNIACAIPEVFLTAYQILFYYGKPNKNDVVLIHAGASGVGTTLIQYCNNFLNLKAYVTCGNKDKIDYCIKLGAKGGTNYKTGNFSNDLINTYKNGANIILDCVGQSHWYKNMECIAIEGRWVLYGWLSGSNIKLKNINDDGVNMGNILRKRIQLTGTTLRSRSIEYKYKLIQNFEKDILPLINNGKIKPIISKIFNIKDAQKAHDFVRNNSNIGKVVLNCSGMTC